LKPAWANIVCETLFQKTGLVEWLKVKALSPSPRKKEITRKIDYMVHGNWSVML
jgi:hypothetical protein